MNKPQAEGRLNSRLYSRKAEKEGSTFFSNKKLNNEAQLLSLSKVIFAY